MGQLTDFGGVVEVVSVVHEDRLGEVGEDEGFEGVQVAVAEQIERVELGARDQQVFLGLLSAWFGLLRSDPQRGLVGADHVGQGDQGADPLVHLGQEPGSACEHAVHEPRARGGAGQRLQQFDAPLDGDELHHYQVHGEGLQIRAVADGPGADSLRAVRGVHRAAAAAHRMLVILGDFDTDLRDLMLLVTIHHPKVGGIGQIVPALAVTLREPILLVIGPLDPGEVRSRRSRLLALGPLGPTTALPRRRGRLAGIVVPGRRHGGVARVAGEHVLNPG
jgi:hypothetical protein